MSLILIDAPAARSTAPGQWPWVRLLASAAGLALLWLGFLQSSTYDVGPGYVYTLGLFPILAALALTIIGLARGVTWVRERRKNSSLP